MDSIPLFGYSRLDISGQTQYNNIIKIVKEIAAFNKEKQSIRMKVHYKEGIT